MTRVNDKGLQVTANVMAILFYDTYLARTLKSSDFIKKFIQKRSISKSLNIK